MLAVPAPAIPRKLTRLIGFVHEEGAFNSPVVRKLHALVARLIHTRHGLHLSGGTLLHLKRLAIHAGEHYLADAGPLLPCGIIHCQLDGFHLLSLEVDEGGSLVTHTEFSYLLAGAIVNLGSQLHVIATFPVHYSHLDRSGEAGTNHQIMPLALILGAPTGHYITIHRMRCRMLTLVGITGNRYTGICRIAGAEILEFPTEIESLTFPSIGRSHTQSQQGQHISCFHHNHGYALF